MNFDQIANAYNAYCQNAKLKSGGNSTAELIATKAQEFNLELFCNKHLLDEILEANTNLDFANLQAATELLKYLFDAQKSATLS